MVKSDWILEFLTSDKKNNPAPFPEAELSVKLLLIKEFNTLPSKLTTPSPAVLFINEADIVQSEAFASK